METKFMILDGATDLHKFGFGLRSHNVASIPSFVQLKTIRLNENFAGPQEAAFSLGIEIFQPISPRSVSIVNKFVI